MAIAIHALRPVADIGRGPHAFIEGGEHLRGGLLFSIRLAGLLTGRAGCPHFRRIRPVGERGQVGVAAALLRASRLARNALEIVVVGRFLGIDGGFFRAADQGFGDPDLMERAGRLTDQPPRRLRSAKGENAEE